MKVTTHLRNLLTAVVCLFAGVSAQAQFTATYEPYPATNWGNESPVEFKLSEVATALETDSETLSAALDSWTAEGSEDANMFFLKLADGLSDNYTQGGKGGFWVNVDGEPQGWSGDNSALRWFNMIGWSVEEDVFYIVIGQYPGQCAAGDEFTPTFVLQYGEKSVEFKVTIKIAAPAYDIPDPATLVEKDLNIVGSVEVTEEQYPVSSWSSNVVEVELADVVEKLGLTGAEMLSDVVGDLLYATEYDAGDEVNPAGLKKAELTHEFSADPNPGFWLRDVENEQGEKTGECSRAPWGEGLKFYVADFKFNAENNILSCQLGQYPNVMSSFDKYFTNIYLIYGDKAYRIRYNLSILERDGLTLDDVTKVGEEDINLESPVAQDYPDQVSFTLDIEKIAEAVECSVDELTVQVLDTDEKLNGESSAGNQGFWLTPEGFKKGWQSGVRGWFIENPTSNDFSKWNVGQEPKTLTVGEVCKTTLFFVNENALKYYGVNVTLTIVEGSEQPEFVSVASKSIVIQQELNDSYTWSAGTPIPEELIAEKLGEDVTWTVYGLPLLNEDGTEPDPKYTKSYTCTPYPGFWLNKDGRNNGWNADAVFGITVDGNNNGIQMIQYPGNTSIGDVLKTQVFLVDESTGKMITINVTYQIVDEVKEYEEVGSASIVLPVDSNEEQVVAIDLTLTEAAELLGVTVDDLLNENNYYWYGMTSDGIYGEGQNAANGLAFDPDGGYNSSGSIFFYAENKDGQVCLIVASDDEVPEDFDVMGAFCLRVGDKQYVYNMRLVSPAVYTGISTVGDSTVKNGRIYDLSGRQVANPVRGLYIQNGKKMIVK